MRPETPFGQNRVSSAPDRDPSPSLVNNAEMWLDA